MSIINMINDDITKRLSTNRLSFDSTYFKYLYCVAGKSTQLSYKKIDNTTENYLLKNLEVGNKIYLDQKRPITPILYSENRFLIIFIDTRFKIAFSIL
jgi:hypothetical protein